MNIGEIREERKKKMRGREKRRKENRRMEYENGRWSKKMTWTKEEKYER